MGVSSVYHSKVCDMSVHTAQETLKAGCDRFIKALTAQVYGAGEVWAVLGVGVMGVCVESQQLGP